MSHIVTFDLKSGYHDFLWSYSKYVSNEANKNSTIKIKSIQINGIDLASYNCNNCVNSVSASGSSICEYCKANSYYDSKQAKCIECPSNRYSYPNTLSDFECFSKRKCEINDFNSNYTECKDGNRESHFFWNDPLLCDNSGMTLPANKVEKCKSCHNGQFLKNDKCLFCNEG